MPLWRRVRQIELALERLRWVPDLGNDKILVVNIPMFRVWGLQPSASPFSTEVIVGRALNTRTPVLFEEMDHVIFRPYWNIPSSIVRNEIMPAVRRNPAQPGPEPHGDRRRPERRCPRRARDRCEPGAGATGGTAYPPEAGAPATRSGWSSSSSPTHANVYMHGTPAPAAVPRARRDFSHGCIRVADVMGLAQWVLSGSPEWTRGPDSRSDERRQPLRVNLAHPIRVVLFYVTAVVTPADGAVHFVEDIYGHDARLDAYLTRHGES